MNSAAEATIRGLPAAPALCYRHQPTGALKHKGSGMHIDPAECHRSMDYSEHQRTYKLFLKLALYTVIGVAALLVLLTVFVV